MSYPYSSMIPIVESSTNVIAQMRGKLVRGQGHCVLKKQIYPEVRKLTQGLSLSTGPKHAYRHVL